MPYSYDLLSPINFQNYRIEKKSGDVQNKMVSLDDDMHEVLSNCIYKVSIIIFILYSTISALRLKQDFSTLRTQTLQNDHPLRVQSSRLHQENGVFRSQQDLKSNCGRVV